MRYAIRLLSFLFLLTLSAGAGALFFLSADDGLAGEEVAGSSGGAGRARVSDGEGGEGVWRIAGLGDVDEEINSPQGLE